MEIVTTMDAKEFDETKAGVKGLVDLGIDKIPRFFVHLPENLPKESDVIANGIQLHIPVIDLQGVGDERRPIIVEELGRAAETWGFFQMVNHGIPVSVLDKMMEGVRQFHEQPTEMKQEIYSRDSKQKAKFYCNGTLFTQQAADWRDTLGCSFLDDQMDSEQLPSVCREILVKYINCLTKVKETLSELLSEALGLDPNFFRNFECMKTQLVLGHYYPTCPEPDLTLGARRHTDPSFLTILLQDNIGGLQVHHQQQWVNVPPMHGALVANIGDLLQLITNDKFKSVEHRVLVGHMRPRTSVASFCYPIPDDAKQYGPIKELLSEENPPIYREISVPEYLDFHKSAPVGSRSLHHFKLSTDRVVK